MSFMINPDDVQAVLLNDGWHDVAFTCQRTNSRVDNDASSFEIDAYEFVERYMNWDDEKSIVHYSGGAGFSFQDAEGARYSGPLASVLAVRYASREILEDPNWVENEARRATQLTEEGA